MSETWKDSARQSTHRIVLEVVSNWKSSSTRKSSAVVFPRDGSTMSFALNGGSAEKNWPQSSVNFGSVVEQ